MLKPFISPRHLYCSGNRNSSLRLTEYARKLDLKLTRRFGSTALFKTNDL